MNYSPRQMWLHIAAGNLFGTLIGAVAGYYSYYLFMLFMPVLRRQINDRATYLGSIGYI